MDGRRRGKRRATDRSDVIAGLVLLATLTGGPTQPAAADPPRLQIDVQMPDEATGTMHYANRVTIKLPGVEPLVYSAGLTPIFDDQVALGATRYLVLGWSSSEGTNQTLTVMLVERRRDHLALIDSLAYTSSRGGSVLLVRPGSSGARIGITAPFPPQPEATYEDPWHVMYGKRSLTRKAALRLRAEHVVRAASDHIYPRVTPIPRLPEQGMIWFEAGPTGFTRGPSR